MLKINLSDGEGNSDEGQNLEEMIEEEALEESIEQDDAVETESEAKRTDDSDTMADMLGDVAEPEEPAEPSRKRGGLVKVAALILLLVAVAAVIFTQRTTIMSLFARKPEAPAPVAPPPPPPEPAQVRVEPDPTFVTLGRISEVVPSRVWLSSAAISSDGSYEIAGMSFSHDSLGILSSSLASIGQVGESDIPAKTKSSETVYRFSIAGGVADISSPEILDMIPSDDLAAIAGPVVGKSADLGVEFKQVPEAGKTYMEQDLPFMLEGSFEGLRQVIGELCPEGGQVRVYRLVIKPAGGGRSFDRVQASFSLRTTSSI